MPLCVNPFVATPGGRDKLSTLIGRLDIWTVWRGTVRDAAVYSGDLELANNNYCIQVGTTWLMWFDNEIKTVSLFTGLTRLDEPNQAGPSSKLTKANQTQLVKIK